RLVPRSPDAFPLSSLTFSADGRDLAAGGGQGTVHFWRSRPASTAVLTPSQSIHLGLGDIVSVVYSRDARFVACASMHTRSGPTDDFVALLRATDGTAIWRSNAHPGGASCVAFTKDGRELVSAGVDGTIKFWRITDLAPDG